MSSSGNAPQCYVKIGRINCGGTQTAQFEKIEEVFAGLHYFGFYQELYQISGGAGNVNMRAIPGSKVVKELHVWVTAQGLVCTGDPKASEGAVQKVKMPEGYFHWPLKHDEKIEGSQSLD